MNRKVIPRLNATSRLIRIRSLLRLIFRKTMNRRLCSKSISRRGPCSKNSLIRRSSSHSAPEESWRMRRFSKLSRWLICLNSDFILLRSFEELSLPELMASNVSKAGYSKPTPIQKFSMKNILDGKDLMACSQTGSGKTAAFLLPIMSKLTKVRLLF